MVTIRPSTRESSELDLTPVFVGASLLVCMSLAVILRSVYRTRYAEDSTKNMSVIGVPEGENFTKKEGEVRDHTESSAKGFIRSHLLIGQFSIYYLTGPQRMLLLFTGVFVDFAVSGLACAYIDTLPILCGVIAGLCGALVTGIMDWSFHFCDRLLRILSMFVLIIGAAAGAVMMVATGVTSEGWMEAFALSAIIDLIVLQSIVAVMRTAISHR